VCFIQGPKTEARIIKNYYIFHNAALDGQVSYLSKMPASSFFFGMKGDTNYYYGPFSCLDKVTRGKELQTFAVTGDRIIKDSYSDTFILIKNGIKYAYERRLPGKLKKRR
jgi:hypothetical protein